MLVVVVYLHTHTHTHTQNKKRNFNMLSCLTPKKNTIHRKKEEKKMGQPVTIGHAAEFFRVSDQVSEKMNQRQQENITTERIVLPWNKSKIAFKVRNVLTPEECQALIKASESGDGYERALLNIGGGRQIMDTDYRDSYRVMIDHPRLSTAIYDKTIGNNITLKNGLGELNNGFANIVPVELNERLRFLKYYIGQKFSMHCDGSYTRPSNHVHKGDRSYFTILIYLNKDYKGSTRLFSGHNEGAEYYDVIPEEGMVFVHQHDILHAGMDIKSGTKYCIRSDIMCRFVKSNEKKNKK
jgi:hypothetical protein